MEINIESICVSDSISIRNAIARIDQGSCAIVLVVDAERRLLGTITDGDVRRAMLASIDLEVSVSILLARKTNTEYSKPVTALEGTPPEELLAMMQHNVLRQIPILDDAGRVIDLVMLDDLLPSQNLPLQALIMAGGLGTRLRPLTEDLPKPMLPVGGKPLMERVVQQLRKAGIRQVNVSTHYKPGKITEYFGNGDSFGVRLTYINEADPLGTGGALGLIATPTEPLLVINGDILTQVDFRAMMTFHQEHQAQMTVGVRQYGLQVPYGVVECEGGRIRSLQEKPHLNFFVNAGIYLIEPEVFQFVPSGKRFHMTDLIKQLLDADLIVASFPIHEYWLDIGQHADYEQAREDACTGILK